MWRAATGHTRAPERGSCTPEPHFSCLPRCPCPLSDGCWTCPQFTLRCPVATVQPGHPGCRQGVLGPARAGGTGLLAPGWLLGGPHMEGGNQKGSHSRRLVQPCQPRALLSPCLPSICSCLERHSEDAAGDASCCSDLTSVKGIVRADPSGTRDRFHSIPGCRLLVMRKDL